jgi:S1-C subfamily serine protease
MIMATAPGSIAQRYGLGRGDLVLAVNGAETRTVDALERALASANRHWVLRMQHDGRVVDFEVRN